MRLCGGVGVGGVGAGGGGGGSLPQPSGWWIDVHVDVLKSPRGYLLLTWRHWDPKHLYCNEPGLPGVNEVHAGLPLMVSVQFQSL